VHVVSDPTTANPLADVVREVELHAARVGWDQPALLFALVDTADLVQREPQLADLLGVQPGASGGFTPVEQETVSDSLEELLPTILWPPEVEGCAVVVEATTAPPGSGDEARIVAGVLRTGESWCAIRHRAHDDDDMVLTGDDLVPALLELLHTTLEPDGENPPTMSPDE
jgi:hypothetical protein